MAAANELQRYRLLRYIPNVVSGEFHNIAVLLYDANDLLVGIRFAREFKRIACHPLADMHFLEQLREEFEDPRLSNEGRNDYLARLDKRLSRSLVFSAPKTFFGASPEIEIERLYKQLVADSPQPKAEPAALPPRPGTHLYLRKKTDDAFAQLRLFDLGVERNRKVSYGPDRAVMTFDYAYRPNGHAAYVQTLSFDNDLQETLRIGFIQSRLAPASVSVVVDERTQNDVLELLGESGIRAWAEPSLGDLAAHVYAQLTR